MLASFTSTDSESENPPLGNPLRFRAVENRFKLSESQPHLSKVNSPQPRQKHRRLFPDADLLLR